MRIISGKYKGRRINPDKYFKARPTTDLAKESIFNVITNYKSLEGISVLDIFSGTGSISYEFASRGAKQVISIEKDYNHYLFIKNNIRNLGLSEISVFKNDYKKACDKLIGQSFDIIFADPPYDMEEIINIPNLIFKNNLLKKDGILIIEHPKTISFNENNHFIENRKYGRVNFSILSVDKTN